MLMLQGYVACRWLEQNAEVCSRDGREKPQFYFFNSFFWKKLCEKAPKGEGSAAEGTLAQRNHARVKKWTKVWCHPSCPYPTPEGLAVFPLKAYQT